LIERIEGEHAGFEVGGEQSDLDVVAAECERQLGEVVGAEREEVGVGTEICGDERGTRCLDHRADADRVEVDHPGLCECFEDPAARHREFGGGHHQRDHDLDLGVVSCGQGVADRAGQRSDLHLVHAGFDHAQADATGSDHGVGFAQSPHGSKFGARLVVELADRLGDHQPFVVGEELVQRRVKQPNRHRQPVHGGDDRGEIGLLNDVELVENLAFVGRVVTEDQSTDQAKSLLGQEHVLGPTQSDSLCAQVSGVGGVVSGVGIGADAHPSRSDQVGPPQQRLELRRCRTCRCHHGTFHDVAGPTIDRDLAALGMEVAADVNAAIDDDDVAGADDCGDSPAPRDDRGMAHETTAGGEDAAGRLHAQHVVGGCLGTHEDHVETTVGGVDGSFGAGDDAARRCSR